MSKVTRSQRGLWSRARKLSLHVAQPHILARIVPLTFCLCFLLSTGPLLQQYVLNGLNSDATSIYASSYRESLSHFPPLLTWLTAGVRWPYLSMALAISVFCAAVRQPRQILGHLAASSFVVLSCVDLFLAVLRNGFSYRFIFENVLSNLVGALALSSFAVAIYSATEFLLRRVAASRAVQSIAVYILVPLGGVVGSTFLYYAADLFYRPVPTTIDVHLARVTEGKLLADEPWSSTHPHNELKAFDFFAENASVSGVQWVSTISDLSISWKAPSPKASYDVSVELFDGCISPQKMPPAPKFILRSAPDLRLSFNGKYAIFDAEAKLRRSLKVQMVTKSLVSFDVVESKVDGALDVSQFVLESKGPLIIASPSDEFAFVLKSPIVARRLDAEGQDRIGSHRRLTIASGGREYFIDFRAHETRSRNEEIVKCKPLPPPTEGALSSKYAIEGVIAAVRVAISEAAGIHDAGERQELRLEVLGDGGHFTARGIEPGALAWIPTGRATFLVFHGDKTALFDLDGKSIPLRAIDNVAAMGDFAVHFENSGQLLVSGTAHAVWRNQKRLSPTRWERMDGGVPTVLGAVLLALFAAWTGLVGVRLEGNKSFDWFVGRRK